jgi:hypothetical protein
MAARQIWLFLSDADVAGLLAMLERREPGLVASEGRYLRGDPKKLLAEPEALERRAALHGEQKLYLFHRKHSADVVAHLQAEGPFAGWQQIDEERSDCLVLRRISAPEGRQLQPARLYGHTSLWRGEKKIRKRPVFAVWCNQTLRWLLAQFPRTSVEFMRIGNDALERSRAGTVQLTYLYRAIAPEPAQRGDAPAVVPPPGTISEAGAVDEDD